MNPRKLLVSMLFIVCIVLVACAPEISTSTITPFQATMNAEAATWPVKFVWQVNGRGPDNPNGFGRPTGIAVDSQSNVYIVDGPNHRVQKFDTNGKLLTMWGSYGNGDGQFMFRIPRGHFGDIAVDGQGNVYVTDANQRVQKFDGDGRFLTKWGSPGTGDGQFSLFMYIATDKQGNVYIADGGNNRVQKFDSNGKFLMKWGSMGSGEGQFGTSPEDGGVGGIASDSQGNVYVVDPVNHRIEKFDTNGHFLLQWGSPGSEVGQFVLPSGVAVDTQDNVYVTDNEANCVSKFDRNGRFLFKWGETGENPGQFSYPQGIAVDKQGNIYVANVIENIEKFAPK